MRLESDKVKVKIPEGVSDGQRIRVRGHGSSGGAGAPSGDLIVTVTVRQHAFYERKGDDIHVELPITVAEAMRGGEVEVPTVRGLVRAKIPAKTQSGKVFRITGKGLKRSKRSGFGDHYYKVMIHIPTGAKGDADRLVDELEEQYDENPRTKLKTKL